MPERQRQACRCSIGRGWPTSIAIDARCDEAPRADARTAPPARRAARPRGRQWAAAPRVGRRRTSLLGLDHQHAGARQTRLPFEQAQKSLELRGRARHQVGGDDHRALPQLAGDRRGNRAAVGRVAAKLHDRRQLVPRRRRPARHDPPGDRLVRAGEVAGIDRRDRPDQRGEPLVQFGNAGEVVHDPLVDPQPRQRSAAARLPARSAATGAAAHQGSARSSARPENNVSARPKVG